MDASKRIVNLFYAGATLLAWAIFAKSFGLIFGLVGMRNAHLLGKDFTTTTLLGAVAALSVLFWAWRSVQVRPVINEVADELVKVTWPTWEETKNNSKMTIVVTMVVALILWVFDQVFGNLTNLILGGA